MAIDLCSIASGSSGNSIYIGSDRTHILVDAGISKKRIVSGLESFGIKGEELDGIFVTHEHNDHIKGLGVMARKYEVPIYGTKGTIAAIKNSSCIGEVPEDLFREVEADADIAVGDLTIHPFKISHDAAQPVAYRVACGDRQVAVATDMGMYDDYIVDNLSGVNILLLEANHDVKMLEVGPYPYYLKKRILGDKGHLSNELSGRLLCKLLHKDLKEIILGHLSQENNYPELAYETVKLEITMGDVPWRGEEVPIQVAGRNEVSQLIAV